MADLSLPDEDRIDKLRRWLESRNIDVAQVGHELTMPSPFKERAKGQPDGKRRLSVTVVQEGGVPSIRWQCWWSKGKTGKPFGGRSAYALSVLTHISQREITNLLGLKYDEEVERAETTMDKVLAIITQPAREAEKRRVFHEQQVAAQVAVQPVPPPRDLGELWAGSPITAFGENLVAGRGIVPAVARRYGLCWDFDRMALWLPWIDREGVVRTYQWWDGNAYRFPDQRAGLMTKQDAIFGLKAWTPNLPLTLCEGCFTAMSVFACGLGGSAMSDAQLAMILALGVSSVILAFDNDSGGFHGTVGVAARLRQAGLLVIPTFPPMGNDWNEVLKRHGLQETTRIFAQRVQAAKILPFTTAVVSQYRGAAA